MDSDVEGAAGAAAAAAAQETNAAGSSHVGIAAPTSGKKKKSKNGQSPFVFNKDPRYLPNLTKLTLSKGYIEANGIAMCTLSPKEHLHDAEAAKKSEELPCPVFEIPAKMFPRNAPLHKITYLPVDLLPMGFEAGGIFPTGVLSRKYYPCRLLGARYSGMTPPLFVGCRRVPVQSLLKPLTPAGATAMVPSLPIPTNYLAPELCLGYILTHSDPPTTLRRTVPFTNVSTLYVPDLSAVPMMTHYSTPLCITILSDYIHPHVPSVARAALTERTPTIELPARYFSQEANMVMRRPVHLPERYLPPGFVAGCVFGPDSVSRILFMLLLRDAPPDVERNVLTVPPIFVGQWMDKKTPKRYLFPKETYMMSFVRPTPPTNTLEEDVEVVSDRVQALPRLNEIEESEDEEPEDEEPEDEEPEDEEPALEEAAGGMLELDEAAGGMLELDEAAGGEEPVGEESEEYLKEEYLDYDELEDYEYEYEFEYDPDLETYEFDDESVLSPLEDETDEDNRSTTPFVNSEDDRSTTPFRPKRIPFPYTVKMCSIPLGDKPCGGVWFFKVRGNKEDIDAMHRDLKAAGIKLATEIFDQKTLRRARLQWVDLHARHSEIVANMVQKHEKKVERPQKIRKPKPPIVKPTCTHASTEPHRPCPSSRLGGRCCNCQRKLN
ncbi:DM7 family protein GG17591 [Drosophila navojoa]|uniref:DM7 family protein GG17591 n=1 Tax=Drosophila navojoa TaxID=7232 RepID=UPI0011BFC9E7|nr:DM7 family protein GG17591 [Drosophila navojoa]